jgi:hypothetical protein
METNLYQRIQMDAILHCQEKGGQQMAKKSSGFAGMSFNEIAMQQTYQSFTSATYCRFCGQDIKTPTQNSTQQAGGSWHNEWELENQTHEKCFRKTYNRR